MSLAVQAATVQRCGDGVKMSPSRRLRSVLKGARFQFVRRTTYPFDRAAPFDPHAIAFLTHHFKYLRSFAYPYLSVPLRATFDRMTDPDAADSLYRLPDAELVCINAVYLARSSSE